MESLVNIEDDLHAKKLLLGQSEVICQRDTLKEFIQTEPAIRNNHKFRMTVVAS